MNSRLRESGVYPDQSRLEDPNWPALHQNSPWTYLEVRSCFILESKLLQDEKLTEAVGVYDGQGRGGSVDWNKVNILSVPIYLLNIWPN